MLAPVDSTQLSADSLRRMIFPDPQRLNLCSPRGLTSGTCQDSKNDPKSLQFIRFLFPEV